MREEVSESLTNFKSSINSKLTEENQFDLCKKMLSF